MGGPARTTKGLEDRLLFMYNNIMCGPAPIQLEAVS